MTIYNREDSRTVLPQLEKNLNNKIEEVQNEVDLLKADYIVEQGTDGIWTYRKWNSGIAECWGKWTETLSNYSTVGTLYGFVSSSKSLPFSISNAVATYTVSVGNGFAMPASGMGSIDTEPLTAVKGYSLATNSGSRSTIWEFQIYGTWK